MFRRLRDILNDSHRNVICDFCMKEEFSGKRYKCKECYGYDLCESCFASGVFNRSHEANHPMVCLLTKADYDRKLKALNSLLIRKSCATVEGSFCFDFGNEVFAERSSPEIGTSHLEETTFTQPNDSRSFHSVQDVGPEKLIEDLQHLLADETSCDVTFDVSGKTLKAHKTILMARSPTFSRMFHHDMAEANTSAVTITDFDGDVFRSFLVFLYTASVDEDLMKTQATDLYQLAEKYFVTDLKRVCKDYMRANVDVDGFCDVLFLALKYCDGDLLDCAKRFCARNVREILVSPKWKDFIRENPEQANEMMIAALNCD